MNQKEFFNSMAEKWDEICRHDGNKINKILDLVGIHQGARILDVGTGTGVLIPFLVSRIGSAGEIVAVDLADKMIEVARKKHNYTNVKFIAGDIFDLELPKEYFDIIMCYSVFPHFEHKDTAPQKLGKFLKPGGELVICHSQSRDQINNLHKNSSQAVSMDYLPEAAVIRKYFSDSGFDTIIEIDNERMFVLVGQKTGKNNGAEITYEDKNLGVSKREIKWLKGTDDLTDAFIVRFNVFVDEQQVPAEIEIDDIDKIAEHIVVYVNNVPVGTGRVFSLNGQYMLGRIAVLKEYRKQHIGSLIVKALLNKAWEMGADEVHIHAQVSALKFYYSLGFIPYGEHFDEAGIEHVSMVAYKQGKNYN